MELRGVFVSNENMKFFRASVWWAEKRGGGMTQAMLVQKGLWTQVLVQPLTGKLLENLFPFISSSSNYVIG